MTKQSDWFIQLQATAATIGEAIADVAARAAAAAAAARRADQLADLPAPAMARVTVTSGLCLTATEPPALPANYIDDNITGPDRELLTAFYTATNSEGGTADEIHLRGIRAAIAHAATGGTVPTPVEDALRLLLRWGGMPGSNGYDAQVVLGVVDWATSGMIGPLPPLPPRLASPVDLTALHDPTFSDGLTPSQHRDVLRGGPDPRVPELVPPNPVVDYSRVPEIASNAQIRAAAQYLIKKRHCDGDLIPAIEYAIARWGATPPVPLPVARPLSEWTDDDGDVLWWRVEFHGDCGEPPWVGSPLSDDWLNDYYTHWTPLPGGLNISATEQP